MKLLRLFLALTFSALSCGAQTYRVIHTFTSTPDGAQSYAALTTDGLGNLYGTTVYGGGPSGGGTVFEISASGKETILYAFGRGADGGNPYGRVIRDNAGNLYGTTVTGGNSLGLGTVFKLDPAGHEAALYAFSGMPDGAYPKAGVVRDAQGNLYGTTSEGGMPCVQSQAGCGTVFKLDSSGHESILHSFTGGSDGALPTGDLLFDKAGNLYGTASAGGTYLCQSGGCGLAFRISPNGQFKVLYEFQGVPDGAFPFAGLIQDSHGNLYGTAHEGGVNGNFGTVFQITGVGQEKTLYSFECCFGEPSCTLLRDGSGNLYGTTTSGGANGDGVVFKVDPSGNETVLHDFDQSDGGEPWGGVLAVGGKLYGTTFEGGSAGWGVVYQIGP